MLENKNSRVSIVSKNLARKGFKYYHLGLSDKCMECVYRSVCSRLKPGALYEITSIRDKFLKCGIINDEAVVVTVTEIPMEVAIPQKKSFGTVFTYKLEEHMAMCDPTCPYYQYCIKPRVLDGKKLRIVERIKNFKCPKLSEDFTVVRAVVEL